MKNPTKLEVIRYPANGASIKTESIPLIEIGPGGIDEDECNETEKELEHIPNMKTFPDVADFSWTHRSLSRFVNGKMAHALSSEDYLMYVCLDEKADLPCNKLLGKVLEWYSTQRMIGSADVPRRVYGDAFIFKIKLPMWRRGKPGRAKYIDMDRNLDLVGDTSKRLVGWLLAHQTEKGQKKIATDDKGKVN